MLDNSKSPRTAAAVRVITKGIADASATLNLLRQDVLTEWKQGKPLFNAMGTTSLQSIMDPPVKHGGCNPESCIQDTEKQSKDS